MTTRSDLTHVAETENGSGHGRCISQRPGLPAVARGCRSRIIGITWVQVPAAYDPIQGVAEIHCKCACARRTYEWSVVGVPGVGAIRGRQNPRAGRATGREPGVIFTLGC